MPATLTYPGVYIEEIPSGVRTITGVATSITAFIGRAPRGPTDVATRIQSFADYDRAFGGLSSLSTMSYAVQHYFQHGGSDAYIIRVHNAAGTAEINLPTSGTALILSAASPGKWGNALRVSVNYEATKDPASLYTLTIQELDAPASKNVVRSEVFLNLSSDPNNARFVTTVLAEGSALVNVKGSAPSARPTATITNADDPTDSTKYVAANTAGTDGADVTDNQIAADSLKVGRKGMYALEAADLFNLLCIPPLTFDTDVSSSNTLAKAAAYCAYRRAMLVVDSPASWVDTTSAETGINTLRTDIGTALATNVAVYFPRLRMPDPMQENRLDTFVPCGAVAGIMARTDAQRGVWKAPAGLEASFSGVPELAFKLNDAANGRLNPLGLNCNRSFPTFGNVVWGARTLAGADMLSSDWKYVPVRRLALFLEESLYRGTQWIVFEPNDEPLWAQIRLNIGAFMHNMFRLGAFQGKSPQDAYFVKCDKDTTTQNDINLGIVNIVVGFAPLKPAEFVVIKIQQMAGQIET
ncbi:MAG: phage tail sheath family protein [Gammaproteobacteria bacterium]|nr:phage tail sheath family protein [Gammaproteobacteria bacterium]